MKIQILGTGCSRCKQLAENAERAIVEAGLDGEVIKVQEIADILEFDGVRALPALAIDGQVRACGRIMSPDEIRRLIGG